ncbi:uncharacterized protein LOC142823353 [Pelodiscus sinensis]|uniref:uncharacterized protein LOC142823353 n=1 Tax=Pelodiscus sinensis TaxID=13735 RepID=UPI003F6C336F
MGPCEGRVGPNLPWVPDMGARDPCWPLESPWSLPSRTEPPCASAELCQERVDSRVEEVAIYDIEEQLHTRDTSPAALQRFLLAIPLACLAALQRGEDTLAPRCCKDTMMARIVEIMEDSPPPLVLADCLNAACSLSTLQPPLRAQLLSPLLTAAVGQTVSGDWQQEPIHTQQFIRALPYDLQALLASLLAESPDTARLQLIMEHLSPWLESRLPQERARALGSTTALLGVATTLPGFDNSADWPRMGHHVAQLGLFISDPSEDVSRLAREGVHSLYQLLLHHRGLNIHQAEDLWCRHYYKERWVLAHSNSVRVGEVFGQLFTAEQENCFLDKALLAARSPLRRPSQAGLVLAHALHGQAHQLLEYMPALLPGGPHAPLSPWVSQEIMEDSPPPLVLADCLNAACSLSTLQPPLRAQLLSPLLTAAVGQTVSGDWQQEPIHTQQFIRALPYDLQALLASLLAESPDTARLQLIMEHLSPWLESRLPQERARALGSTTALLGVATTLPGFDNSADWPRMGHHVAQLGLFISDPSEDVSRLAREGVHSLYQLLLHHRGTP